MKVLPSRILVGIFSLLVILAVFHWQRWRSPTDHDELNCNTNGIIEKFSGIDDSTQCPTVRVDTNELLAGNPRKDGIPAIDKPNFLLASEAEFSDDELIIGVAINGDARAYPYSILNWHEIVNDTVGGVPVAVTYCPLCETNSVFVRVIDGEETTFGTSGALYNSCLVMYDRISESLWVQPWGVSIFGDQYNEELERVPGIRTTLGKWKTRHPETKVLSTDTGFSRDYGHYPYGSFYTDETILFPARNQEVLTEHPKEISFVAFSKDGGKTFNAFDGSYAAVTLREMQAQQTDEAIIGNETVEFRYDKELDSVRAYSNGEEIPLMAAFGFVIPAFFE